MTSSASTEIIWSPGFNKKFSSIIITAAFLCKSLVWAVCYTITSLLLLKWDENAIEESLKQHFLTSHRNRGSSTEPALRSIKEISLPLRKAQKSFFLKSKTLKRQCVGLEVVPRNVNCAEITLWFDRLKYYASQKRMQVKLECNVFQKNTDVLLSKKYIV